MSLRPFLRPLPLFVVFVFVAVAGVDLVQTLREEKPPPPVVLKPGDVRFEAFEPVIDLRNDSRDAGIKTLPSPVFVGGMWSEADGSGRWALGHGAELTLDLIRGGQRVVVFEGRPAAGRRPVRRVGVSVNGVDCGSAALEPGWQRRSVTVPDGALRAGPNVIVFQIPDRLSVQRPRRALQLRQIELRFDPASDSGGAIPVPVSVDFEAQQLMIRRPGMLEAGFTVDDRVDALRMRYRLQVPGAAGEMTVARPQGDGVGRDAEVRRVLSASQNRIQRVRVPLHGRRGEFVLRLSAEPATGQFLFDIRSLELVTEKNRSRTRDDRPG